MTGINSNVYSQLNETESAVFLQKGQTTPFSGLLLSEKQAQQTRRELIERDNLHALTVSYEKTIQLQQLGLQTREDQVENLRKQNNSLYEQVNRDKAVTNFERVIWFGLGVIGTGFAVYGASKLAK